MATSVLEMFTPEVLVQYLMDAVNITQQQAKLAVGLAEAIVVGLVLWKVFGPSQYNLPPGPRPLPLLGNLLNIDHPKRMYLTFENLKKKYGDIVTFYFGPKRAVLLNSADVVREVFLRQGNSTANRPYLRTFMEFSEDGMDIVFANYSPRVHIQKKLAHSALRKFATGEVLKSYLDSVFECLTEHIDSVGYLDGYDCGFLVAYNILASMAFGKKYKFEDPFLQEMMDMTKKLEEVFTDVGLTELFPNLRFIPTKSTKALKEFIDVFNGYLEKTLDEHRETFDPDNLSDFTYHLLNTIKEAEADPDDSKAIKLLEHKHYIYILFDLFIAGTDTTRMTLNWIWTYLAAFPDIQRKAQEEVDSVLGRDGPVTAKIREQLPYVDAFLHEVMRLRPVVPTGIFHETTADIKVGGFDIPKGTMLIQNTWAIHADPKNWKDPEAMLPERWLNENGQYVFQQNGFQPFSVGKRSCVGESFAKLELHMLTTMMLQKYTIKPQPGKQASLACMEGIFLLPVPQKLIAKPRE